MFEAIRKGHVVVLSKIVAGVSAAASSASAIFAVASGGSGPGLGRSLASLQFFAWSAGLAGAESLVVPADL